ncbi:MAG: hypothetical protein JW874_07160 [Spirochaetales bacterium]|nr:hypothetical protein [Spirochaetales bacterium]
MKTDLTEMVLRYQKERKDYSSCFEKISELVYLYPKRKYRWPNEQCSDFYTFFYPLIERIVNRFSYRNSAFEAYLNTYLRYNLKRFIIRQKKQEKYFDIIDHHLLWHRPYSEFDYVSENELEIDSKAGTILGINKNGVIMSESFRKRYLYLVLKNTGRINSEMKEKSCQMLDMEPEQLDTMMDRLNHGIEKRLKRFNMLSERRNLYVSRIFEYQKRLLNEDCPTEKNRLRNQLMILKKRLGRTNNEISRVQTSPTYREISEILDVPKGSVDSGIYYLRNRLEGLSEKKCS